ncbi:heavy metal-associated isoprenylated plant protein 18 [Capsella rubella]|uniref:heavy metal-associated isoprenylated plant protein 18 n=1 Tax=Capsella rubella TaxID=81985 RepID=UPI000CD4FC44|nr:heavy metal-associated isoprenylated plant protein 18 [Capsella rubella]
MGWWFWKRRSQRRSIPYDYTMDAELKIKLHCENCAKKLKKVLSKLEGVEDCLTDVINQKIMVAGAFDLERMLKIIKKKTGKNAEILVMTKRSDAVQKEDIEPDAVHTNDGHELVHDETTSLTPKKEENSENESEASLIEVEFKIPFLDAEFEECIKKVISKFEGITWYVVDNENQKVVVTGSFDEEKLSKKLKKKIDKKMEEEESKIAAKKKEESDKHAKAKSDDGSEIAKYMMVGDANPNACCIS